jgi:isoleucyl-tRNA synthetase
VTVDVEGEEISLSPGELLVEPKQREGYALEREAGLSVALSTVLDGDLMDEGLVRELVHRVQNLRREKGFEIEESISVGLSGNPRVSSLLEDRWGDYFKAEVLARELELDAGAPEDGFESVTVDGEALWVRIKSLDTTG